MITKINPISFRQNISTNTLRNIDTEICYSTSSSMVIPIAEQSDRHIRDWMESLAS